MNRVATTAKKAIPGLIKADTSTPYIVQITGTTPYIWELASMQGNLLGKTAAKQMINNYIAL
ncbi:hypothetical protein [Adhaeribacter arboris]|nr:hypothetical protein [Adhaeribacter arboris]